MIMEELRWKYWSVKRWLKMRLVDYGWYWVLRRVMRRVRAERRWYLRRLGRLLWQKPGVRFWNEDKPHRCPDPSCYKSFYDETDWMWLRTTRSLYQCCGCGLRFARWPRLAYKLRQCESTSCLTHLGAPKGSA